MSELRGFKFAITLVLEFKKIESDDATKYSTFYSKSKAETVINESGNDDVIESIYSKIMSWKSKTRVTSYELRVQIHELRVQIHELRVQIYELRVQIHELRVQIHELRVQIHELED